MKTRKYSQYSTPNTRHSSLVTPHSSLIVICSLLFTLLISCQSTPRVPEAFMEDAKNAPLNTGGTVYIFANVKAARPIIELLPIEELKDSQTKQMLDKTNYFAGAIYPPSSGRRFQIAAWGNYPSSQAGFALSVNRNWKQYRSDSGQSYWHSEENQLSILINSKQAYIVSSLNSSPVDPSAAMPGIEIPEGFNAFRQDAPISFWVENPITSIQRVLVESGLPIQFPVQQFFINLFTAEGGKYEAAIRFRLENNSQARGMVSILNLAGAFASNDPLVKILLTNPAVQDGRYVGIKTSPLTESEIVNIFNIFLR